MKKHQAEVEKVLLGHEKEVYRKLKKTYNQALKDINKKSKELQKAIDKLVEEEPDNETLIRSKIYQLNYQKTLQAQISGYMDVLKSEHVKDINDYMNIMYEDSYISNFYNLNKLGVPVTAPINQELLIKALTYDTNNIPLSKRVYDNVEKAKKDVLAEIQRGISTGMSGQDIARNIQNRMGVSYRKAKQLAQNEGHRVKTDACIDSMHEAKKKGADIVKVWDATLDGKTRPVHAELDQQHAEIDEPFKFSGGEVQAPKKFGMTALDINCRCALISVPRWDIEDTVTKRDNVTGELIEAKNYAEWKEKYYNVIKDINDTEHASVTKFKKFENKSAPIPPSNSSVKSDVKVGYKKLSDEDIKVIQEQSDKWYENLSDDGKGVLEYFTLGGYYDINEPLFNNNVDYLKRTAINDLETALKSFELKNDIIAYRGVSQAEFDKLVVGKEDIYKEFKSTSLKEHIADGFKEDHANGGKIIYKIHSGTSGAYIGNNTAYDPEFEFLLNRNAKYKVVSIKDGVAEVEVWTDGKK